MIRRLDDPADPMTTMLTHATTLTHDAIAALIPHSGAMCLLARLERWDARRIVCSATNHRDADHPLRTRRGLLAACAIEYAAQAMALHGALLGQAAGTQATPGFLASARGVQLHVMRLDDLPILTAAVQGAGAGDNAGSEANDASASGDDSNDDWSNAAHNPDALRIEATRQAGDANQILYAFRVSHAGRPIADGRAAVVLNTALA